MDDNEVFDLALEHFYMDQTELHQALTLGEAGENLIALQATLRRYGASKALLHFADHEGILSRLQVLPSLEAYSEDLNAFDREVAQEALLEKIKSTIGHAWTAIAGACQKLKSYLTGAITWTKEALTRVKAIEKVVQDNPDKEIPHEQLAGVLAAANADMTQLAQHGDTAAKEELSLHSLTLEHFGESNPSTIIRTCTNNIGKVNGILEAETSRVARLESLAHRLDGTSHPDQIARQREITKSISVARMFIALLLKTVGSNHRVASVLQHAYNR